MNYLIISLTVHNIGQTRLRNTYLIYCSFLSASVYLFFSEFYYWLLHSLLRGLWCENSNILETKSKLRDCYFLFRDHSRKVRWDRKELRVLLVAFELCYFSTQDICLSFSGLFEEWNKNDFSHNCRFYSNGSRYLRYKSEEIYFHRFPYLRCASNKMVSSWRLHYFLLTEGSKWLCHLRFNFRIPFTDLFWWSLIIRWYLLHFIWKYGPFFSPVLLNKLNNDLIFLRLGSRNLQSP